MLSSRISRWLGVGNQLKHMELSNQKFAKLEKGHKEKPKDTGFWATLRDFNQRIELLPQKQKAIVGVFVMFIMITFLVAIIAK